MSDFRVPASQDSARSVAQPHHAFWPRRVPRQIDVPRTSLWHNLQTSAARYPDKAAYVFLDTPLSYASLLHKVERLGAVLAGGNAHFGGVKKGDRVILLTQNSPQFVIGYYACLAIGAAVVPVNPMNKAEELTHYITDPDAQVAICTSDLLPQLLKANASLPIDTQLRRIVVSHYSDEFDAELARPGVPAAWASWIFERPALPAASFAHTDATAPSDISDGGVPPGLELMEWQSALQSTLPFPVVATGADDMAVLPYTSGTTGLPKGCVHTHATINHNVLAGGIWGQSTSESVLLAVTPMFHITGMLYALHGNLYQGATAVLMPRWDREFAGRAMSRYRVTHWTNIPTMVIDLMASPNWQNFDLTSLQYIGGGGAAMPQAVAQKLLDDFGLKYVEGYGLTETAAPSHSNPMDRPKQQCLGMPYVGVDSRVFDVASLPHVPVEMPVGEAGEICICGPMVFKGYWKRPDATEAAFFEFEGKRFFRSGDLGKMDVEGYFFMTDRLKRMINASGFKVWPAEVEALMFKHPAIQEACVIATHDAYRGESVKAVVVKRAGAEHQAVTEQAIVDWCKDFMASYKAPKIVQFVDVLPKSGSGKVMWRALQEAELSAK